MLSKLSVRRPYTVLVAVVLVIVLGVVSFNDMHTDLLPDMEFPYAIVMTTYAGASPEEVETTVTKPVEQTMASVSNIKNINSISMDNASMVMLEFNQSANMDSITIEMRESLDTITSAWDDTIGNPIIMKINPDMMPIMVAGIDFDDMESTEVTDAANTDVIPELESVEGVASVSTAGEIKQKVDVIIRQEKIDEMNELVQDAIEGKLKKAEDKINKGQDKIADGKNTLTKQQKKTAAEMAKGETKLSKASKQIEEGLKTIATQTSEVKAQKKELEKQEKTLLAGQATLKTKKAELEKTIGTLTKTKETLTTLNSSLSTLLQTKATLEQQVEAATDETQKQTLSAKLTGVNAQIQAIDQNLSAQGMTRDTLASNLTEVTAGLTSANAGMAEINKQETTISQTKTKIAKAKKQINEGLKKLESTKKKLLNGDVTTKEAMEELSKQKVLASIKLSVAEVQLANGETELSDAKTQLKETKKTTKESSDLNTVITKEMVKNILTAENFEMPAGYITEEDVDYLVRVGNKMDDTDTLSNLVIADFGLDDLEPITLGDVADINVTDNSAEVYAKINGNPAVAVTMEKQTGYSTGDVTDRLLDKFTELEKTNEGLHITTLMNQGVYIDLVVGSVRDNLLMGAILAIIILLLFLRDIRPTFIVACSIPLSLITAIVLMYFSGVTLNIISLSGLALGVGMLVDNSVVVIENIYRMRREGASARAAAVEGAREVAGAILASTLTTVCVFAPIVFTDGITRQLFVDLGLTLAYSLFASLVVALTLVPALSGGMLRNLKQKESPFLNRVQGIYGKMLDQVLRFRVIVIILSFALLVGAVLLAAKNGTAFMPEMESTEMSITMDPGKEADLEQAAALSDQVITAIEEIPDIKTIGAMSGGGGMMSSMMGGSGSSNSVSMYILLNEDRVLSNDELKKEIEECTKDIKCELDIQTSSMDMSALGETGISVAVQGKGLDKLQNVTKDIMKEIENVEGITNISNGLEEGTEEFRVNVDKAKAMEYTLTVAQVFEQINKAVAEAQSATTISTDTKDYDVYVKNDENEKFTQDDIKNMKIEYTNKEGKKKDVKLSKIADFEKAVSPNSISRENQIRTMTVSAELEDGYNIGLVSSDVREALKDYEAPEGYTYEMQGEDETINESMGQVGLMFLLGVIFMYLIMVAQFQSLLSPFIILFTIPLAFTGGFLGLFITGSEISVIAMIGFVMLSGVIVNNGIVLVDYINQLRRKGMEKKEAMITAGKTRLRPILMTALTTILGLVTMAMGLGMGGEMVQPMAIVTIGGLLYGTLLTLFVVPCIYSLLNRKKDMTEKEI